MKHLSLSIPQACSENWNSFTPRGQGGFCTSCNKTVIDFTNMNDEEIFGYFTTNATQTCGRFRPQQLKAYQQQVLPKIRPGLTLLKAGVLSLLFVFVSKQGSANLPPAKTNTEIHYQGKQFNESTPIIADNYTIRGVVTDPYDNQPVAGVNILLKGTNVGVTTDINGQFEFPQKLKEGDVLIFSFIGYDTQQYRVIKTDSQVLEVKITLEYVHLMGEVVVNSAYTEPTSDIVRWWKKVKNLF